MSSNIFEKILKIVQIVVTILLFALKSIYGAMLRKMILSNRLCFGQAKQRSSLYYLIF